MGVGITVAVVCTVSAYTYNVAVYLPSNGASLGYTGIVNGAQCGFALTNADAGDFEGFFNTTTGLPVIEGVNCTVPAGGSACTTPYITFSGAAFAYETIEVEQFFNGNINNVLNGTYNWTYIALPPVPSQTPQPLYNLTANPQLVTISLNTSSYSSEYGYPLIGCVVSAGKSPYAGGLAPATLSSNPSSNSIPAGAYALYSPAISQGSTVSVPLSALYVAPNARYDFHWVCYNSVGKSFDTLLFNVTTSSSLPVPQLPSSTATVVTSTGGVTSSAPVFTSTGGVTSSAPVFTTGTSLPVFTSSTASPTPSTPNGASATVASALLSLTLSAGVALALLWA